jgi:hypothetical protein
VAPSAGSSCERDPARGREPSPGYAAAFGAGNAGSVTGTCRALVLAASLAMRVIVSSRSMKISANMVSSLVRALTALDVGRKRPVHKSVTTGFVPGLRLSSLPLRVDSSSVKH